MTTTSIETSSPTASSAKIDFSGNTNDPNPRAENSEFGQVMSGVLQSCAETKGMTAGQEMAAQAALQPGFPGSFGGNSGASWGGDFLKAVNLGPYMNVITSEATVPDEQSLEAFARSQGLDETAVQWLMGSSPSITAAANMTSLETNVLQAQQATARESAQSLNNPDLLDAMNAVSPSATSGDTGTTESLGQPTAPNPAAMTHGGSNVSLGKPDMPLLPHVLNAAALWAMSQAAEKSRLTSAAQEDPREVAKVQINLMASPAPAAFWMLRNPQSVSPAKEAVNTPSGIALSEIDLTLTATPELMESLSQDLAEGAALNTSAAASDQPTPLSGHTGQRMELAAAARQDAQNPDASTSAPDSGNAQRSESVKNLAEKMGQAVGQRILSEIEKGQWHLKLSLRPATLGHIEVEMRMRSGELDAVFTAPQAMTRELLQEGMSKLKDSLSQMGMDVASMQVGGGQSEKRGGESTPQKMSKSMKSNSDDPQLKLPATVPLSRTRMGQDGWDVLV
jgi:flagellar hook-length control protein FliK